MRRRRRVFFPLIRAGMERMSAYRLNFLAYFIGNLMYCFIMYFIWKTVFSYSGSSSFMNFSMADMVTYLFITNLTGYMTFTSATQDIGESIKDGSFSMLMIKPISFETYELFQEIGNKVIIAALLMTPIVIGVEWYRSDLAGKVMFSFAYFVIYLFSLCLSYLLSFYFSMCVGFLAFFLKNIWGFSLLKTNLVNFFSGAVIPIAFMPQWAQNILYCLPFASLSYTPVMIYMGKYGALQTALSLFLQAFWALAFWALSKLVWLISLKHVTVQGG